MSNIRGPGVKAIPNIPTPNLLNNAGLCAFIRHTDCQPTSHFKHIHAKVYNICAQTNELVVILKQSQGIATNELVTLPRGTYLHFCTRNSHTRQA